jgi:hypothetical protein
MHIVVTSSVALEGLYIQAISAPVSIQSASDLHLFWIIISTIVEGIILFWTLDSLVFHLVTFVMTLNAKMEQLGKLKP